MLRRLRVRRARALTATARHRNDLAMRQRALEAAEAWLAREPLNAAALLNRAEVLLGIGDATRDAEALRRALADFREAVERVPAFLPARLGEALALHGLGNATGEGRLVMEAIGKYAKLRQEPDLGHGPLAAVLTMEALAWKQLDGPGGPPQARQRYETLRAHAAGLGADVPV